MPSLDELKNHLTKIAGERSRLSGQKDTLEGQIQAAEERLKKEFACDSLEAAEEKRKQLSDQINKQITKIAKLIGEADSILKGEQ